MSTTRRPATPSLSPALRDALRANPDEAARLFHECDRTIYLMGAALRAETEREACACLVSLVECLFAQLACMTALAKADRLVAVAVPG